jgi:type I restriction enzyme M protein
MSYPIRVAERRSERLIEELLDAQAWDLRRPPAGGLLTQQEYKDHVSLRAGFSALGMPLSNPHLVD